MHISGHGRAHELASLLLGVQEADRPAQATAKAARSQHDSVDISQHAKELADGSKRRRRSPIPTERTSGSVTAGGRRRDIQCHRSYCGRCPHSPRS